MPSNAPRLTKAQERDASRQKALQLRAEQEKRARRSRIIGISGLVVALAILGVVVAMILSNAKPTAADLDPKTPLKGVTAPTTATDKGGISVGKTGVAGTTSGDKAVKVTVYYDYLCPYCEKFETANGSVLDALTKSGDITVEYHPISFLDSGSQGTKYSTRTAAAAAYVADADPSHFVAFHEALFKDQPAENTSGKTDAEIAQIAVGAGVPQAVADKLASGKFTTWVTAATSQAQLDGVNATPTVLINGKAPTTSTGGTAAPIDLYTAGPLEAAIRAALG